MLPKYRQTVLSVVKCEHKMKQRKKQIRKRERIKEMEVDFFWFDKNWKQRGEGNNVHLIVYYNIKKFRYILNTRADGMIYNSLKVERKGDIDEYVKALEGEGFSRID